MNPLSVLKSILETLHGEDDPSHIAAGFALGAALGLVPKANLFAVIFFLLFFFFRVDKGMALLSAALFTPLGYALDPLAHHVGSALLFCRTLRPCWTWLYSLPIVPWTRFNNTVVLGSLVIGLALFFPLYVASKRLVLHYRAAWKAKVDNLPWVKAFKGWGLVSKAMALKQRFWS